VEPAGEFAELLERLAELEPRGDEDLRRPLGLVRELGLRQAKRERERREPLLRAVVEVPFEPPPRGVGGGDDSAP
jgi:hypothetical protein